jgi:hypothetical protein
MKHWNESESQDNKVDELTENTYKICGINVSGMLLVQFMYICEEYIPHNVGTNQNHNRKMKMTAREHI